MGSVVGSANGFTGRTQDPSGRVRQFLSKLPLNATCQERAADSDRDSFPFDRQADFVFEPQRERSRSQFRLQFRQDGRAARVVVTRRCAYHLRRHHAGLHLATPKFPFDGA